MTKHDAESLKILLPELTLQLETEHIRFELQDNLQLQAEVKYAGKEAYATIHLNDEYKLVFRPAISGFNGLHNWFKWRQITHPKTNQVVKLSQIRSEVSLVVSGNEAEHETIFSMGLDAPNMEQLVPLALEKIHRHCGLRLVALPQVTKKMN